MIKAALVISFIHLSLLITLHYANDFNYFLAQGLSLVILSFELWLPFLYLEYIGEKPHEYGLFIPSWHRLKSELIHLLIISMVLLVPYFTLGYIAGFFTYKSIGYFPLIISVVVQILGVALPEEIFYRGFLQNIFLKTWPNRVFFLGLPLGRAILLTNIIFAAGHFVAGYNFWRLLTFFPGLIFSYLSYRNRNITTAVLFHALCNVLGMVLQEI